MATHRTHTFQAMLDDVAVQRVIDLIERNRSVADFADFGDGVRPERIAAAEKAIGVPLPESYKWWLANYGGGEIGGEEVFSIYAADPEDIAGGDVAHHYRLAVENGADPKLIPLCHSDIDGLFAFRIDHDRPGNEYPVLWLATGGKYAGNFLEFIEKRINSII